MISSDLLPIYIRRAQVSIPLLSLVFSEFFMLCITQVGIFPLFKTLWVPGLPNHKSRKLHSVRLSPSFSTLVTWLFFNFYPTNTWPKSRGPSHIYVSPWHIKEIQGRKRNNKISGLLAALSEVISHTYISYREITTQPFHSPA